jgi:ABC-2 type transport system permease protein
MFTNMFSIEHTKIFKQRMLWIVMGIIALIAVGMVILLFIASQLEMAGNPAQAEVSSQAAIMSTWPGALINVIGMASAAGIGSLLVITLVGAAVTQEYQWRTMHLWFGRGVSRPSYTLARFASLLLPILLLIIAALISGGLVSMVITLAVHGSLRLEQLAAGQLLLSVLRSAYTLLPYAALAFLLGIATRSTAAAVGIGLAFALLVENLIAQVLVFLGGGIMRVVAFLPLSMARVLVGLNEAAAPGLAVLEENALPLFTPLQAAIGIAVYTLLLLGLSAWLLQRQDLTT